MVALLSGCLFTLVSCDKIEAPYTEGGNNIITDSIPTFPALPSTYFNKVLLEEYTGIKCVNCPTGSQIARNLKDLNGDTLVLMEVHCGDFAIPDATGNFTAEYRTQAGTAFDNKFGMSSAGLPDGMVNRVGYPTSANILYASSWGGAVVTAKLKPITIAMQIINNYNQDNRILKTFIKTTYKANLTKNLMLSVLIVEDSIISPQKNGNSAIGTTPEIIDYVHKHVLRDAINSTWGTALATTAVPVIRDSSVVKAFSYSVNPDWNDDHCSVYAFVYDNDTYEIYQIEELKLE